LEIGDRHCGYDLIGRRMDIMDGVMKMGRIGKFERRR